MHHAFEFLGDFTTFCALVGLLFFADLLAYLPFFYVGFAKTEEEGYQPERGTFLVSLGLGWLLACAVLIFGAPNHRLLGTLFLYLVFRHYYIDRRWSSIRRGFGAPGFMSHWTLFYLLLLQVSAALDSSGWLAGKALLTARIDFAVIMICAGTYKYLIGYMHSEGWEYGRVNPMWGYFWRQARQSRAGGAYITFTNAMASGMEVLAGFLMLTPGLELAGALIISLSFIYVGTNIRLGRLAMLMAVLPCLFSPYILPTLMAHPPTPVAAPALLIHILGALMTLYIVLLPLVKISQYSNLFANKRLPQPWHDWLTGYANAVPITIWRVFTPDVTNFFVRIVEVGPDGRDRVILNEDTYSMSDWSQPRLKLRFLHVTESIAIVSVFTTLKYFPSNRPLFDGKLLTYARSLQHDLQRPLGLLRFEYVAIVKGDEHFQFDHVGNFYVDLSQNHVREEKLVAGFDFSAPSRYSPLKEGAAPGSYMAR